MLRRFSLCSAFCFVRTVFNRTRLLRSLSKKEHNLCFFLFLFFFLFSSPPPPSPFFFFSFFNFFISFLFYLDLFGHGCSRFICLSSSSSSLSFFLFFSSNSFFPFLDPSNPPHKHTGHNVIATSLSWIIFHNEVSIGEALLSFTNGDRFYSDLMYRCYLPRNENGIKAFYVLSILWFGSCISPVLTEPIAIHLQTYNNTRLGHISCTMALLLFWLSHANKSNYIGTPLYIFEETGMYI